MSIGAELLNPIPGPNPAGVNLNYDPLYDKIKEARRQDDPIAPRGDWSHELKKADWPLVIKISSDLLSNRTKDLQLAAWLTEALLRREGLSGLQQGLNLCRGLIEQFWDTLYPELEDGDAEERAMHLDWVGSRLGSSLGQISLTHSGFNWFKYKESRAVGNEADAANSESKQHAREQAISDGKLTAEEFDKAVDGTPKAFYQRTLSEIGACMEAVSALSQACEMKFGRFAPSFTAMRDALEQLRQAVSALLARKRETEPDVDETAPPEEAPRADAAEDLWMETGSQSGSTASRARAVANLAAEPTDREDAYNRVAAIAAWLRKDDPYNPVPYILVRAMRWGELRALGSDIDPALLEPPSTQLRTEIKRLFLEGNYEELFPLIEGAASAPCGRGWLDLQRFFCNACDNAGGYDNVKSAVIAALRSLLSDFAALPKMTLLDDTPTANPETLAWLEPLLNSRTEAPQNNALPLACISLSHSESHVSAENVEAEQPSVFELALQAASEGRKDEAIGLLAREVSVERCGRDRFLRQVELAQICLSTGHETIAYPILEGLGKEIETRRLEGWEKPELLAHALSLLFRCADKVKENSDIKHELYARICRLDPVRAMDLKR